MRRPFPLRRHRPAVTILGAVAVGIGAAVAMLGTGCTPLTAYERSVADFEPIYCYRSLAAVTCHARPDPRDAGRLVNFYGPPPARFAPPPSPRLARPRPPAAAAAAPVRDPEPVVGARPPAS
jgi:hypothetical protein